MLGARQRPAPTAATGEFVAGIVGGIAAGALAYRLAEGIANDRTVKGDAGYSPAGNVGFALGATLGVATGVYLAHRAGTGAGSWSGALLGAAIPGALMLAGVHEPYMPILAVVLVLPLQAVGARIGVR
jgi:hypothetical protein